MDIQSLRYFLSVYRSRSFSKAAKDCYVTQPVISRKIAALEEEFQCVLYQRTSQGVLPTEGGKRFLEFAEQMLRLYEEAEKSLPRLSSAQEKRISIAALTPVTVGFLPRTIARFYEACPGADVLLERYTPGGMQAVLDRDIYDFYITIMQDLENRENMSVYRLAKDGVSLITRSDAAVQNDQQAAELLRRSTIFIVPQCDSPHFYDMVLEQLEQLDVRQPLLREVRPVELHDYCVAAGMGVALSPKIQGREREDLCAYSFKSGPQIELGIGWSKETPLMKSFLDILFDVLNV